MGEVDETANQQSNLENKINKEEDVDDIEDDVDPRVKDELDALNKATDDINRIETDLSEHRGNFKLSLQNATQQLEKLAKKYGKNVEKARPYFDALKEANQAKSALDRSVQNFQRATGIHRAAKETIALAEERLREFGDKKVDQAWQEMLNIQTKRFMDAEKDKFRSERLHETAAKKFEFLDAKAQKLKKKRKISTRIAKPYFELKDLLEYNLQKQRIKVDELQAEADDAKRRYRNGLSNLERISSEIHEKRKQQAMKNNRLVSALEERKNNDDSVADIAKHAQLDIMGPKAYDNIEDLEDELDGFTMEDYSGASEDEGSDEEIDGLQKPALKRSVSTGGIRPSLKNVTSSRMVKRQSSMQVKTDQSEKEFSDSKPTRRRLKVDLTLHESIEEDSDREQSKDSDDTTDLDDVKNAKQSVVLTTMDESTYCGLHGTAVKTNDEIPKRYRKKSEDFDIFEELC